MISPLPSAPDGSVTSPSSYSPSDFSKTSAILCRNTAPLVSFAFSLLRRSVPCNILGRDIGAGLKKFIQCAVPSGTPTMDEIRLAVGRKGSRDMQAAERKGKRALAEAIEDRTACALMFLRQSSSLDSCLRKIDDLFTPAPQDRLTLATVHKAKGLEWDTVFILDRHLMPSKYAEQDWEKEQEKNINYVAVTRARLNLGYITSDRWK